MLFRSNWIPRLPTEGVHVSLQQAPKQPKRKILAIDCNFQSGKKKIVQSKLYSKLALVLLLAGGIITSQAASVGSAGYTNAFTGAAPGAADWSTRSVPGASGDLLDATALGAAVITNSTSSITAALSNGVARTWRSSYKIGRAHV